MPFNENNVFYQDPVLLPGAQVTPRIVNADVSLPATPFDFADAQTLFANLNIHEFLVTALAGANNDLAFIARTPGTTPTVRVTFTVAGNNTPLSIAVVGEDITVNVATGAGGAATSTAAQVKAAIEAHAAASALVVVELAPANDGTGVVTALAQTPLAGPTGTTPTMDVKLQHGITATTLADHSAFAQKTAASVEFKTFANVASKGQWVLDRGADADEVFAVSIVAQYRPKA
jgi:hypothetical protein